MSDRGKDLAEKNESTEPESEIESMSTWATQGAITKWYHRRRTGRDHNTTLSLLVTQAEEHNGVEMGQPSMSVDILNDGETARDTGSTTSNEVQTSQPPQSANIPNNAGANNSLELQPNGVGLLSEGKTTQVEEHNGVESGQLLESLNILNEAEAANGNNAERDAGRIAMNEESVEGNQDNRRQQQRTTHRTPNIIAAVIHVTGSNTVTVNVNVHRRD